MSEAHAVNPEPVVEAAPVVQTPREYLLTVQRRFTAVDHIEARRLAHDMLYRMNYIDVQGGPITTITEEQGTIKLQAVSATKPPERVTL
jgi:hypothetical protein